MSDKAVIQLGKIIAALDDPGPVKHAAEFVRGAAVMNTPVNSGHLREHIFSEVREEDGAVIGEVYTRVKYAPFVEFGTGPKGAANHEGISPEVSPAYTMSPWWIHESQLDVGIAEMYHWRYIDTPQGRFYICYGQPAQPFLYPALADNKDVVLDILGKGYEEAMKGFL